MFTFLGTSAGEQYPGVFCNCGNCSKARELGGRNIRRNSSAILGNHTLLDFGPAIANQLDAFGHSFLTIDTLLVTHAHEDHFFPWYLRWRLFPEDQTTNPQGHEKGPTFTKPLPLTIYGSKRVRELTLQAIKQDEKNHHLEVVVLEPWKEYTAKHVRFVPLVANHDFRQDCYNFVIEYQGKTMLYAVDTAWFLPEAMEFLKDYTFDLVVMEGTFGFNEQHDYKTPGHCNFLANRKAREWMLEEKMIQASTPFVITHTGPHHAPPHDECEGLLAKWDLRLAYDGMHIEL
jgi:phosphoribosyl 1,2-cyclic phosphate phosphodiesterase